MAMPASSRMRGEALCALGLGVLVRQPGDRVVGNHVQQRRPAGQQLGQPRACSGLSLMPPSSTYSNVSRRPETREVLVGRGQDRVDADLLVDRHQPIAQLVVGRVQRDGQVKRMLASASRSTPLGRPTVEIVTRRGLMPRPLGLVAWASAGSK